MCPREDDSRKVSREREGDKISYLNRVSEGGEERYKTWFIKRDGEWKESERDKIGMCREA